MNIGTLGLPSRPRPSPMETIAIASISLNVVADTAFTIPPIIGKYYYAWQLLIRNSGIVASLTAAQFGLFTAPQGGGTAIIASGTALSGITSNSDNTAGNFLNPATTAMALRLAAVPKIYFRVTQVQAAGAAIDAVLYVRPLP